MSINSYSEFKHILNDRERCVVLHSLEGEILGASPLACEELGYSQEEIVQLVLANIKALDLRLSDVCLKHEEAAPVVFQRRNGRRFPATVTSKVTRILRDRQEQNIVQLEFHILSEVGQDGNPLPKFDLQESASYLDLLGQEIRHPLVKLGVFLESLQQAPLDPALSTKLNNAITYHTELMGLTGDVADWFKLGINVLHLDKQPFNLVAELDNVISDLEPKCKNQECTLSLCLACDVSELAFGDVKRVSQLLKRLVLKALSIHEPNQLRLNIGYNEARNSEGVSEISFSLIVHNYNEEVSLINGQNEVVVTNDAGLGIVSKLVKIMGGQLKQHRRSDVEYEYFFNLAVPGVDTLDLPSNQRFLTDQKVLLVDNDDSLLKYQLMQWGAEVEFFASWQKAKNYLGQISQSQHYTIKILQLSKEERPMDIVATCHTLPGTTVYLSSHTECTINAEGISYIPWPVQPGLTGNALATLIRQTLPYPYSHNQQARIVDAQDNRPCILFVDDVETIRLTFHALLEKASYKVDLAQNGIDAILACDQNRYDLIIIDIQMPFMDGIEAASHIRNSKNQNRHTPILAVSGDISENSRIAAEKVGIRALHPKSSSNDDLLFKVDELIRQKNSQPFPTTQEYKNASLTSGRRAHDNDNYPSKDKVVLNIDLLKNLVADTSLDVCTEMVGIFMQESKQSVAVIDQASHHKQWQNVKNEAHAIKSTSYTFGCEALYHIASLLETEIDRGDFDKSADIVDEMAAVFSESYLALEDFFRDAGKPLSQSH